jgi:hypothetical protein
MNPDRFDDLCSRLTGLMLFVATYGVFALLIVGVILGILE